MSIIRGFIMADLGQRLVRDMRRDVYKHMQTLSLSYFEERKTGDIMSRATNDVEAVRFLFAMGLLMALDPPLLICDELTAGLDPPLARHVCDILKGLNRDFKVTCVVATHNVDTAFLIADKIVLLKRADKEAGEDWEGTKIIAQGTVEEVKKTDNKYIQEFLSRRAET
jgi:ABC-type multidrug transport system fused ATPase/permease subunit